jgi:hypothetical protein
VPSATVLFVASSVRWVRPADGVADQPSVPDLLAGRSSIEVLGPN